MKLLAGKVLEENRRSLAELSARLVATADSVCGVFDMENGNPHLQDLCDQINSAKTYADIRAYLRHLIGLIAKTLDEFDEPNGG